MTRFPNRGQKRDKRRDAAKQANAALAEKGITTVKVSVEGDRLVVRPKPPVEVGVNP